jgi:hypothetical protein
VPRQWVSGIPDRLLAALRKELLGQAALEAGYLTSELCLHPLPGQEDQPAFLY